ncbi:MAG: 50S ribosomal protein L24e [Candidatus Altiarchaeota archaeon]
MDCTFCGRKIEKGTGVVIVSPAGKAQNLCSSKCRKNMIKLGRKPRKVKWTKTYREEKQIRIRSQEPSKEKPAKEKPPAEEKPAKEKAPGKEKSTPKKAAKKKPKKAKK